jgi:hypothetical protein
MNFQKDYLGLKISLLRMIKNSIKDIMDIIKETKKVIKENPDLKEYEALIIAKKNLAKKETK